MISFYLDAEVPRAITRALRGRSVDVLTAQEDGIAEATDVLIFERAQGPRPSAGDRGLGLPTHRQRPDRGGITVLGAIFIPQISVPVGISIQDLELIANVARPEEIRNRVFHLPLR